MKKTAYEVKPLDIRKVRRKLGLTLRELGKRIAVYSSHINNDTFVPTRISEWEKGHRAVPGYVYRAVAYVVLDEWSDVRHAATSNKIANIDAFYGGRLSVPFGELLRMEHALGKSRRATDRAVLTELRKIRREQQRNLERMLDITMGYVFAAEPGGFDEDAAGECL